MANKRFFWLKLPEDFFRDLAVKRLRRIAGGDTYTIIYLKMLLATIKTDGKFFYQGIEADLSEEIALQIDEEPDNVKVALNYLIKVKLVSFDGNEAVMHRLPDMVGSESSSAKRVREYREREKQKLLQCNANVTDCNVEKRREEVEEDNTHTHTNNDVYIPPTLGEVIEYCKEHAANVDPLKFHHYYASLNWMIDGEPMWNWKERVQFWKDMEREKFMKHG